MKLGLRVLSPGKRHGELITVRRPIFLIGRDAGCHLRPASTMVANHQCAILLRDGAAVLQSLDDASDTFVNERRVVGSTRLRDDDHIRIGTIELSVRLESVSNPDVRGTTPRPATTDPDTSSKAGQLPAPTTSRKRYSTASWAARGLLARYMKKIHHARSGAKHSVMQER
jgi:predicted component of type VI protein secretion system